MKKRGFTLIELLATIVVLLIIVIVSTPSVISMIDKSGNMTKNVVVEKIIDAAKEYTSSYNRNVLNELVSIGDKSQILAQSLIDLGLIKKSEIDLLEENTVFVQITLKENYQLDYKVLHDPSLIENSSPHIVLLGDNPYYLKQNSKYVDPGFMAFDGSGENITKRVQKTGDTFDTSVLGTYIVTYNVTDAQGNVATTVTRTVIIRDASVPSIVSATMQSNNSVNNKKAKNGNTITLNITFSKAISIDPTVTIGGRTATVTGSGTTREATYTIPAGESTLAEGDIAISVSGYKDIYDNMGAAITTVTTGGLVNYDRTVPTVTAATIISNNALNNKRAKNNDTLTLSLTFSEPITSPTITIHGRTATVTGSGTTRTATYTIPTSESSLVEGNITISVSNFIDGAANVGTTSTTITSGGTVYYDRTPPTCAVSGGNAGWLTTGSRIITGTCSDSGIGCSGNISYTYSTDINTTTAGAAGNGVGGTVSDLAGNIASCAANQTVKIDKTPPTCAISGGNAGWTTGSRTITGTCTDQGTAGIRSECTGNISYTYSTDINTTTAGAAGNGVGGTVYDNAGNSASCAANQTVKIDKTPPTCTVSGGSTTWTNGNRIITGTCADQGTAGIRSECTGNISYTYSTDINTTTAGAAGNNAGGTVYDNAGNGASCAANQTVKIDKTPPTYNYFYIGGTGNPTSMTSLGTTLYISASGATKMCIKTSTASCTDAEWETYATTKAHTFTGGAGTKTLYIWFKDDAENAIGYYSDSIVYGTPTDTYNCLASGYSSTSGSWSTSTSTVIQGTTGSYTNYYGAMFFGANTFANIRTKNNNFNISSVVVKIKSHVGYARTVRLYVGGPCPTPNYTTNAITGTDPTPVNTSAYQDLSIAANALGTWTITNSTWINALLNANSACLYIHHSDSTSYYWEGDGALHSTVPTMTINWVAQ